MKQLLFVLLACSGLAAAPALAAGDAAAGKSKAMVCGACHGADGNSAAPTFPSLAGQGAPYLIKQMADIKSGARSAPAMTGQLDSFSEQDIADVAAYYSAQTGSIGQADPDLVARGESIYRAGIASKGVAACTACHSPTGKGNAPAGFPALGGQHAAYLEAQLKAFRTGADEPAKGRTNDGESRLMRDVAGPMSDLDIRAVASYIQGLH